MQIKKVSQISTKNGDKGNTLDYSNRPFKKNNILFEVLGTIDELSSNLGLAYHYTKYEEIIRIQQTLQQINSLIATDSNSNKYDSLKKLKIDSINWLENTMQNVLNEHPLEAKFSLPGSEKSLNGAYIDVCRTITRRAERRLIELIDLHKRNDLNLVLSYINRLSDFLFVLSNNL